MAAITIIGSSCQRKTYNLFLDIVLTNNKHNLAPINTKYLNPYNNTDWTEVSIELSYIISEILISN